MARKDTLALTKQVWLQLTNSDATLIRIQPLNGITIEVQATVGEVAPLANYPSPGALHISEVRFIKLSEIFPDNPLYTRIYVRSMIDGLVSFSHD